MSQRCQLYAIARKCTAGHARWPHTHHKATRALLRRQSKEQTESFLDVEMNKIRLELSAAKASEGSPRHSGGLSSDVGGTPNAACLGATRVRRVRLKRFALARSSKHTDASVRSSQQANIDIKFERFDLEISTLRREIKLLDGRIGMASMGGGGGDEAFKREMLQVRARTTQRGS